MDKRHVQIKEAVIDILKKFLSPSRIYIFGSRAKGLNAPHSDFDFAVDCGRPSVSAQRKINEEIEKAAGLC